MDNQTFTADKRTDPTGKVTIYSAHGQLNGRDACFDWLEEVRKSIQAGQKLIVINLADVPRVDSTGIGIIAAVHVSATNGGGKVCLTGLSKPLWTLFESTWLLRVIPHAEKETDAIHAAAS
jgi:anti-anti-sigma factor